MVKANEVKQVVREEGADICGIASAERFSGAPKGFQPIDIYDKCKSVVVFARKLPTEALFASNCVPYTFMSMMMTQEVDRLVISIAMKLEEMGLGAVPIPSDDPYEHWEPERSYGRAILSMKHAAQLAGLGVMGKNTLLINKDYGNMIRLGAVLVDAELEPDPVADYEACLPDCRLCLDSCPQHALDGDTVNQKLCRPLSNFMTEKGYTLTKCHVCRSICPNALGIK